MGGFVRWEDIVALLKDSDIGQQQVAEELSDLAAEFRLLPLDDQDQVYDQNDADQMRALVGAMLMRIQLLEDNEVQEELQGKVLAAMLHLLPTSGIRGALAANLFENQFQGILTAVLNALVADDSLETEPEKQKLLILVLQILVDLAESEWVDHALPLGPKVQKGRAMVGQAILKQLFEALPNMKNLEVGVRRGAALLLLTLMNRSNDNQQLLYELGQAAQESCSEFLVGCGDYTTQLDLVEMLYRCARNTALQPNTIHEFIQVPQARAHLSGMLLKQSKDVDLAKDLRELMLIINNQPNNSVRSFRAVSIEYSTPDALHSTSTWVDVGNHQLTLYVHIKDQEATQEPVPLEEPLDFEFANLKVASVHDVAGKPDMCSVRLEVKEVPAVLKGSWGDRPVVAMLQVLKVTAKTLLQHLPGQKVDVQSQDEEFVAGTQRQGRVKESRGRHAYGPPIPIAQLASNSVIAQGPDHQASSLHAPVPAEAPITTPVPLAAPVLAPAAASAPAPGPPAVPAPALEAAPGPVLAFPAAPVPVAMPPTAPVAKLSRSETSRARKAASQQVAAPAAEVVGPKRGREKQVAAQAPPRVVPVAPVSVPAASVKADNTGTAPRPQAAAVQARAIVAAGVEGENDPAKAAAMARSKEQPAVDANEPIARRLRNSGGSSGSKRGVGASPRTGVASPASKRQKRAVTPAVPAPAPAPAGPPALVSVGAAVVARAGSSHLRTRPATTGLPQQGSVGAARQPSAQGGGDPEWMRPTHSVPSGQREWGVDSTGRPRSSISPMGKTFHQRKPAVTPPGRLTGPLVVTPLSTPPMPALGGFSAYALPTVMDDELEEAIAKEDRQEKKKPVKPVAKVGRSTSVRTGATQGVSQKPGTATQRKGRLAALGAEPGGGKVLLPPHAMAGGRGGKAGAAPSCTPPPHTRSPLVLSAKPAAQPQAARSRSILPVTSDAAVPPSTGGRGPAKIPAKTAAAAVKARGAAPRPVGRPPKAKAAPPALSPLLAHAAAPRSARAITPPTHGLGAAGRGRGRGMKGGKSHPLYYPGAPISGHGVYTNVAGVGYILGSADDIEDQSLVEDEGSQGFRMEPGVKPTQRGKALDEIGAADEDGFAAVEGPEADEWEMGPEELPYGGEEQVGDSPHLAALEKGRKVPARPALATKASRLDAGIAITGRPLLPRAAPEAAVPASRSKQPAVAERGGRAQGEEQPAKRQRRVGSGRATSAHAQQLIRQQLQAEAQLSQPPAAGRQQTTTTTTVAFTTMAQTSDMAAPGPAPHPQRTAPTALTSSAMVGQAVVEQRMPIGYREVVEQRAPVGREKEGRAGAKAATATATARATTLALRQEFVAIDQEAVVEEEGALEGEGEELGGALDSTPKSTRRPAALEAGAEYAAAGDRGYGAAEAWYEEEVDAGGYMSGGQWAPGAEEKGGGAADLYARSPSPPPAPVPVPVVKSRARLPQLAPRGTSPYVRPEPQAVRKAPSVAGELPPRYGPRVPLQLRPAALAPPTVSPLALETTHRDVRAHPAPEVPLQLGREEQAGGETAPTEEWGGAGWGDIREGMRLGGIAPLPLPSLEADSEEEGGGVAEGLGPEDRAEQLQEAGEEHLGLTLARSTARATLGGFGTVVSLGFGGAGRATLGGAGTKVSLGLGGSTQRVTPSLGGLGGLGARPLMQLKRPGAEAEVGGGRVEAGIVKKPQAARHKTKGVASAGELRSAEGEGTQEDGMGVMAQIMNLLGSAGEEGEGGEEEAEALRLALGGLVARRKRAVREKQAAVMREAQQHIQEEAAAVEQAMIKEAKEAKAKADKALNDLNKQMEERMAVIVAMQERFSEQLAREWDGYIGTYDQLEMVKREAEAMTARRHAAAKKRLVALQHQANEVLESAAQRAQQAAKGSRKLPGLAKLLESML